MNRVSRLLAFALLVSGVFARDVPDNVRSFYNRIKNGKCTDGVVLKDGFYSQFPGPKSSSSSAPAQGAPIICGKKSD